ncbi:MAG: tetratricopeptide repeat protein [Hyphomonadaceae bacterium]
MAAASIFFMAAAAIVCAAALWPPLRAYARGAGDAPPSKLAMAFAGGAGVLTLVLYLFIGNPGLPDGAYADRMRALAQRSPETYTYEEAAAVLADAAKRNPRDAQALIYLGGIEASAGRYEEALRAFEEALRRTPNNVEAMLGLGRVLYAAERGVMTEDARRVFLAAAAAAPNIPEPYFYLALGARQAGDRAEAQRLWRETLARLPENDPRRVMVGQMLAERAP